jgi:predicted phage terminase large subunit-like protein
MPSNGSLVEWLASDPTAALRAIEAERTRRALDDFGAWLPLVSPTWTWDWPHLRYMRGQLARLTSGEIRYLITSCPPRHGKTEQNTVRFAAWMLERDPAFRWIIGAYNQGLAEKFSRKVRRIVEGRVPLDPAQQSVKDWATTSGGGVRACGVGSGVTGAGANGILVDDPVKSRAEAESEAYRRRLWDWFTDDLYTRQEPGCFISLTMTRWHEFDLVGQILASEIAPDWTRVNLPALAGPDDPMGRPEGAALCPERYDVEELERRRRLMGRNFHALFQGSPRPADGDMFKGEWFEAVGAIPAGAELARYWDKAGTEGGGCYSAGALVARHDGIFYIVDVVRGQWSAHNREKVIKQTAERDRELYGNRVRVWVEQEPGSGGQESAENTVRNLAGFPVKADRVSGDKLTRAQPFADQAEAGNVRVVRDAEGRRWIAAWLAELLACPSGKFMDQVDATAGAFNKLANSRKIEFT